MNTELSYRWIDGPTATQQDWDEIDRILAERGWMSLNRQTSRIRLAEEGGRIVGLSVFQLLPNLGPLWVDSAYRGSGVAEVLADDMINFMQEVGARGWIVVADSPHSSKLARERGMVELESPVFITPPLTKSGGRA